VGEQRHCSNCATGWTSEGPSFDSQHDQAMFLGSRSFRPAVGSTQPLIQWVPRSLTPGEKRPWREAGHYSPYADVENVWSYISTPCVFTSFTVTASFIMPWCSAHITDTVHTTSFVLYILRNLYHAYYVICTVHTTSFVLYILHHLYHAYYAFVPHILRHL
jgi:hypothetical protein